MYDFCFAFKHPREAFLSVPGGVLLEAVTENSDMTGRGGVNGRGHRVHTRSVVDLPAHLLGQVHLLAPLLTLQPPQGPGGLCVS